MFVEIDKNDYDLVKDMPWYVHHSSHNCCYAVSRGIRMHRLILGLNRWDKCEVDHKDGNGLNNKKSNLLVCNHTENMRNSRRYKLNLAGCRWVHKTKGGWQVRIFGKKRGFFNKKIDAINLAMKINSVEFGGKYELRKPFKKIVLREKTLSELMSGKRSKYIHKVNFFPTKPWCLKISALGIREFFKSSFQANCRKKVLFNEVKLSNKLY